MDGYHPPILTTPRNASFLEENGELLSADVLSLPVQSNLPNKENSIVKLLESICVEVFYTKWEGWKTVFTDSPDVK